MLGEKNAHVVPSSYEPGVVRAFTDAKIKDLSMRIIPDKDHGHSTKELYKQFKTTPGKLE